MNKKTFVRLAVVLIVIAIAIAALTFILGRGRQENSIHVTGIMDGYEVNLSPKVAGKISWVCCNEGDNVKKGQKAITLDSADVQALVEQAAAGVQQARANIKTAGASVENSRANLLSAEADIKSAAADSRMARAQMAEAKKDAGRAQQLYKENFISAQSKDQSVTAYLASQATYESSLGKLDSARARKEAAATQLDASISQLGSAKAALGQAEANLAFYKANLGYTIINSPVGGTVIFKSMETGETVSPGETIMTVVDLNSLYARADIDETKIGGVVLNSPAYVTVDGMPGKVFDGKIDEIGRYAEFATQRDVVRGREDIKTFRVKVRVKNTEGLLKPGMTVEVRIPEANR